MPLRLATFFYDPDPSFGYDPRAFVALMLVGFVIGIGGHIFHSKIAVALGIVPPLFARRVFNPLASGSGSRAP